MSENNKAPMVKVAGLWKEESKDGNVFYSGKLGYSAKILLFKNNYKRGDKDPDLILYVAKSEERRVGPQDESPEKEEEDRGIPF